MSRKQTTEEQIETALLTSLTAVLTSLAILFIGLMVVTPTFAQPSEVDDVGEERYSIQLTNVESSEQATDIDEFNDKKQELIREAFNDEDLQATETFDEEGQVSFTEKEYLIKIQGVEFLLGVEHEQRPPTPEIQSYIVYSIALLPLFIPLMYTGLGLFIGLKRIVPSAVHLVKILFVVPIKFIFNSLLKRRNN